MNTPPDDDTPHITSTQRRANARAELRAAILSAAAAVFAEEGYEQLSLRKVAGRIGYTATTIYSYFADKDDLVLAVLLEGFERFGVALDTAARQVDEPWERLAAVGVAYVRFALTNPDHYRLMFLQRGDLLFRERQGARSPAIDAADVLFDAVRDAMAAGALRQDDPRETAFQLWAIVHGFAALALTVPAFDREQLDALADQHVRRCLEGFRPA
jgi:AcrR family transcriptional regulator